MREDVLGMPDQIRDALWRVDSAGLRSRRSAGLLVAGMGGSAIGGDLASAIIGERLTGPLTVWRDYGLPAWVGADWGMLASSYSGNTEETLSAFASAGEIGMHRWVAGTGGSLAGQARDEGVEVVGLPGLFQPRAAVAYMVVVAAHVANLAGIGPDVRSELEGAAGFLESNRDRLVESAADCAERVSNLPLVIHGAGPTVPVARRWVSQFNENAKQFAFAALIPEANHNLTEAWSRGDGEFGAVFLGDAGQTARDRLRIDISRELVEAGGGTVVSIECEGNTEAERLFWGVMLGDLVSLDVARIRGVDPVPVDGIEYFKRRLENS